MNQTIVYFDRAGQENTDQTLLVAGKRAQELGIKTVLIASTRGDSAVRAAELLPGLRLIAVSHAAYFHPPGIQSFTDANRKLFESKGGKVLTMTHLFAGLSRAMRNQFKSYELGDIIASTLRLFGDGMKVVCEISVMAADAGLARIDEDIIAIGGTGKGADTAVVLTPVPSASFFALKVKEILCKPRF